MLDSLMLELADAEREQESWFNQSVRGASTPAPPRARHVQWADAVVEEPDEDWQAEDADSDADSDSSSDFGDDDDVEMADAVPLRRVPSLQLTPPSSDEDDDDGVVEEEDGEEDYAKLTLTRSPLALGRAPARVGPRLGLVRGRGHAAVAAHHRPAHLRRRLHRRRCIRQAPERRRRPRRRRERKVLLRGRVLPATAEPGAAGLGHIRLLGRSRTGLDFSALQRCIHTTAFSS